MISKINQILLRRKNKILIQEDWKRKEIGPEIPLLSEDLVATFQKNIEGLGYILDSDLMEKFRGLITSYYWTDLKNVLAYLKGVKRYEPFYPNFPQQVMETSEVELYLNALLHYATEGTWTPDYEKKTRLPLYQKGKLTVISEATDKDIADLIDNLILSKTSLSATDKEDLLTLIEETHYKNFPLAIPYKENLGFICKLIIKENPKDLETVLLTYIKTPTDLLRVLLGEDNKPIKYNRRLRRIFLRIFEEVYNIDDIKRHRLDWVKVGEKLHPGEYKKQFPYAYRYFDLIRSDDTIRGWYSKLEKLLEQKNIFNITDLLKQRPGEFARRLDYLLRNFKEDYLFIILQFMEVANKVSVPVLIQVYDHFNNRNLEKRNFLIKKTNKLVSIDNNLENIASESAKLLQGCIEQVLITRFKEKEKWGKVYISEEFKSFMIPFSQRSASKSTVSYTRGSRLKLEKDFVRLFVWWKNNKGNQEENRIDVDLSVALLDENWDLFDHVSYTNLRTKGVTHSGDKTSGMPPKGACEFLDVNLKELSKNIKYVVISVYDFFPNKGFDKMENCFFGYMEREDDFSGEIFEPSTVKNKFDLKVEARAYLPLILDVENKELIWADFTNNGRFSFVNNVESNATGINKIAKSIFELNRMSLYQLIELNAKARGEIVENKEEADLIFDLEDGIKPSDLDFFMSECL